MLKDYKCRFYPTEEEKKLFDKIFGCACFVYNHFLSKKEASFKELGKNLSYGECSKLLALLKEELPWLKEVSSVVLQQSLRHLESAFQKF